MDYKKEINKILENELNFNCEQEKQEYLCFESYLKEEDYKLEDMQDFQDKLQEAIYEMQVIYYSKAMDYLHNNDTSLSDSMQLAIDNGCCGEDINSELLATLLVQSVMTERLGEAMRKIEELEV